MRERNSELRLGFITGTLRLMLFGLLAIFTAFNTSSCTTEEKKLDELPRGGQQAHQVMLWEATKGDEQAFILGTFHVGISPSELDQVVWDSLQKSQIVVLEMDIKNVSQTEAMPYMFLPPGHSLRQILGQEAWKNLAGRFAGQVAEEKLDRLSLTAVFQMLITQLAPNAESIDVSILDEAIAQSKKTAFLETFAFQAQLLQRYIEAGMVSDLLNKEQEAQAFFQKMVRVYLAGDPDELDRLLQDSESEFAMSPDQYRTMVIARNHRWVKILADIFLEGPSFVAVGAGHLPGKDGILQLLRDQGYQLKRMGG